MQVWLWVTLCLCAVGTATHGPFVGIPYGIAVGLVLLPFWLVVLAMIAA